MFKTNPQDPELINLVLNWIMAARDTGDKSVQTLLAMQELEVILELGQKNQDISDALFLYKSGNVQFTQHYEEPPGIGLLHRDWANRPFLDPEDYVQ
jgi:hypothetical protein